MKSSDIIRERKVLIIFMAVLLVGFLYVIKPFIMPALLASIIVVVCYPLYIKLKNKLKQRKRLAALITTLLIFFILILPASILITVLINQLYDYVGTLNLKQTFSKFFSTEFYVTYVEPYIFELETKYQIQINLFDVLTNFGKQVAKYIYNYSPSVLMGTANFILNFFIMMAGIYFLFVEGASLARVIFDISPLRESYEQRLSKKLRDTIDASVYGYLVTGAVQALFAGIVFAVVGMDSFVILGTMTFFMSMVPIVGSAGVWGPVCVWLFLQGSVWQGIVVLACGTLVISSIDNFLKPIIIEGKTKIHPMLVFFSLFGGITLFGPLGILFGPVITALLIATIEIYREEYI